MRELRPASGWSWLILAGVGIAFLVAVGGFIAVAFALGMAAFGS